AARADVRDVEAVMTAATQKDAELGRRRPVEMQALLAQVQQQLDAARQLRLARERWLERIGSLRAYMDTIAPVLDVLERAQRSLDDIKTLAGSPANALVALDDRLRDSARRLGTVIVPDELKPAHAMLQSA